MNTDVLVSEAADIPVALTGGALHERVADLVRRANARHMIEIGFGGGALFDRLERIGQLDYYVGVEPVEALVKAFNGIYARHSARTRAICSFAELLPLRSGVFDTAVACNTIHWWHNPLGGLLELHRVLKPAGTLILVLLNEQPRYMLGGPAAPKPYDRQQMGTMLGQARFLVTGVDLFSDEVFYGDERSVRKFVAIVAEAA